MTPKSRGDFHIQSKLQIISNVAVAYLEAELENYSSEKAKFGWSVGFMMIYNMISEGLKIFSPWSRLRDPGNYPNHFEFFRFNNWYYRISQLESKMWRIFIDENATVLRKDFAPEHTSLPQLNSFGVFKILFKVSHWSMSIQKKKCKIINSGQTVLHKTVYH